MPIHYQPCEMGGEAKVRQGQQLLRREPTRIWEAAKGR